MTVEEVSQILRKTPNKQCELDPMPTWLVKELCDVLALIITSMANASFTQGLFPDSRKHAVVRQRIKKPSLDPLHIKSYRPIFNSSLVSKTVERLVVNRMNVHVNQYGLFPARQSACRQHHSTETAVTIVHNDIVRSTDVGFVSALGCWISAQHSTPLITAYCWRYSPNDSMSRTLNLTGSVRITPDSRRLSQLQPAARLQLRLPVAFLKVR